MFMMISERVKSSLRRDADQSDFIAAAVFTNDYVAPRGDGQIVGVLNQLGIIRLNK